MLNKTNPTYTVNRVHTALVPDFGYGHDIVLINYCWDFRKHSSSWYDFKGWNL